MTIIALISITGHVVIAGIYNSLLPIPILYSFCLQLAMIPYMVWWLNIHSWRIWTFSSLVHIEWLQFSINHGALRFKSCPKGCLGVQTYPSFPLLWRCSPLSPWYLESIIPTSTVTPVFASWIRESLKWLESSLSIQWNHCYISWWEHASL